MFDFDRDGRINPCEQAMELEFMERINEGRAPWEDSDENEIDEDE